MCDRNWVRRGRSGPKRFMFADRTVPHVQLVFDALAGHDLIIARPRASSVTWHALEQGVCVCC